MSQLSAIAAKIGISEDALEPYGRDKAKIDLSRVQSRGKRGKLVLVTAINPTPAGEGKTTTSIGLGDALSRLGERVALCLREPSLGPCFGMKGGAIGGGAAKLVPAADINLHFTGDFHAITSAHNLVAALVDNALHHGTLAGVDARDITWRRVVDMNDRALRDMVIGLGGREQGVPRESGFDITAASEMMAVLCLARDRADLRERLERIVLGWRRDGSPVLVRELKSTGALVALLKDAIKPNLVRTLEGTPVLVHGGPFANIAHGCNALIATRAALGLADWVVTEAGFGADLGAEKFFDIKCRLGGLKPSCVVVVATVRALKYNGGVEVANLAREDVAALERGIPNLLRHCANMEMFGAPVVVALNRFETDTEAEVEAVRGWCRRNRVACSATTHFVDGGAGSETLARSVMDHAVEAEAATLNLLYPDSMPILDKVRVVAQKIYHAADVVFAPGAVRAAQRFEAAGYGSLPVCVAKTQYSFSDDPAKLGAPRDFVPQVREVRLSAGAGFVVAIMGSIALMPGLPKAPASEKIDVDEAGTILGLG